MHALRTIGLVVAVTLAVAACTAAETSSPSPSAAVSAAPSAAAPSPTGSARASASAASRGTASARPSSSVAAVVVVPWGRIWDRLPSVFPLPQGAEPATPADPSLGVASGIFVTKLEPQAAADQAKGALEAVGYTVESAATGEDGSRAVSFNGAGDCRVMVTATPLGSVHFLTVYYGASCPKP